MQENTVRAVDFGMPTDMPTPKNDGYANADACRRLIESGKITQAEFARQLGCSPAKLGQYYKRRYGDDVKLETLRAFDKQVGKALARWARRNLKKVNLRELYVETRQAKTLEGWLDSCNNDNRIRIIRGATGIGKSLMFRQYQKANKNVYIHTCKGTRGYGKHFLEDLYHAVMGERLPEGVTYSKADYSIQDKLQNEDALLIFDDAHKLTTATLDKITEIFDACPMLGIILGDQSDAQDSPGYNRAIDFARNPQILSRIGGYAWKIDNTIRQEDVAQFCAPFGVTADGVITWLASCVNLPYTRYRWLAEIVSEAVNYCETTGKPEALADPETFVKVHNKVRKGGINE